MSKLNVIVRLSLVVSCIYNQGISGFLINTNTKHCIVPVPCACVENKISCNGGELRSVPVFNITANTTSNLVLDLSNNIITQIPAGAFRNLGGHSLTIMLSNNSIAHVDDNAFDGVENGVTSLSLDGNSLTTLPFALTKLTKLRTLWINSNPVATCNDTILLSLGRRLVSFGLGAKEMLTWPSGMKNFLILRILHIFSINTDTLPPSAFQPFQGQLLQLHLVATKMTHVPLAICDMTSLTMLELRDTSMSSSHGQSIFPQCLHNLTHLQQFYINHDDSLRHFPSLPMYLSNLQVVQVIDVKRLEFITEEDILRSHSNLNLPFLTIEGCSLQRVPSAISKFSKLQILSLRKNKLVTIDTFDFTDYPSLKKLDLSENPLLYVSPEAFANLTSLTELSLSRTNITTLPRALAGISTLKTLEVENTQVECGCDLAWMKGWVNRINMTKLYGKCYKIDQDIAQFIQGDFSYC